MSKLVSCPTFVDRYFTRRYALDVMNKSGEDHCLLVHSNGVCVLTLAPSHPLIQIDSNLEIKSIDYKITEKLDRSENKVCGKSKRGAQYLAPDAPVCRIICRGRGDDDREIIFTIRACMKGRLIEINERLIVEPQLLTTHWETLGYICVIVRKREWRDEDGVDDVEKEKVGNVGNNNPISLIDRNSYLRSRYPECPVDETAPVPIVCDTTEDGE